MSPADTAQVATWDGHRRRCGPPSGPATRTSPTPPACAPATCRFPRPPRTFRKVEMGATLPGPTLMGPHSVKLIHRGGFFRAQQGDTPMKSKGCHHSVRTAFLLFHRALPFLIKELELRRHNSHLRNFLCWWAQMRKSNFFLFTRKSQTHQPPPLKILQLMHFVNPFNNTKVWNSFFLGVVRVAHYVLVCQTGGLLRQWYWFGHAR